LAFGAQQLCLVGCPARIEFRPEVKSSSVLLGANEKAPKEEAEATQQGASAPTASGCHSRRPYSVREAGKSLVHREQDRKRRCGVLGCPSACHALLAALGDRLRRFFAAIGFAWKTNANDFMALGFTAINPS
jgi:hypothetical protein